MQPILLTWVTRRGPSQSGVLVHLDGLRQEEVESGGPLQHGAAAPALSVGHELVKVIPQSEALATALEIVILDKAHAGAANQCAALKRPHPLDF